MCIYNTIFTEIVKSWLNWNKESKVIMGSSVSPKKIGYSRNLGTPEHELVWK